MAWMDQEAALDKESVWELEQKYASIVTPQGRQHSGRCCGVFCARCVQCILWRRGTNLKPMACECAEAADAALVALTLECAKRASASSES